MTTSENICAANARLFIPSIMCDSCVASIKKIIEENGGINPAIGKFSKIATFNCAPDDKNKIIEEIELTQTVFILEPTEGETAHHSDIIFKRPPKVNMLRRYVLQGLLAALIGVPLLILELLNVIPHPLGLATQLINGGIGLVILIVICATGHDFFKTAWRDLKHKTIGMDTLIALGISVSFIFSVLLCVMPTVFPIGFSHTHFSSIALILVAANIGRALKSWAQKKALETAGTVHDFFDSYQPQQATRFNFEKNLTEVISFAKIRRDDLTLVQPGETFPSDGILLGRFTQNEIVKANDLLITEKIKTGETTPAIKSSQYRILAGMKNSDHTALAMLATSKGTEGYICRRFQAMSDLKAQRKDTSLTQKISFYFMPVVIVLALAALITWIAIEPVSGWAYGVNAFVNVILCACPCALVFAPSLPERNATMHAMKKQIYIHDPSALEALPKISWVIFDKSGTLVNLTLLNDRDLTVDEKSLLALLEKDSEHPIAKAILAKTNHIPDEKLAIEKANNGRKALVHGTWILAGNRSYFEAAGFKAADFPPIQKISATKKPQILYVKFGDQPIKALYFQETIKPEAFEMVQFFKNKNIPMSIATGDETEAATCDVAKQLNIRDYRIKQSAEDKANFVCHLQKQGHAVLMVGDGENDGEALNIADVGISIDEPGTAQCGKVFLQKNLRGIIELFNIAKKTRTTIKQNLAFTLIYNVVCIVLAAGVLFPLMGFMLNPAVMCVAMVLSTLIVIANAARLSYQLQKEENNRNAAIAAALTQQTQQNKKFHLNHFEKVLLTGFALFAALTTVGVIYSVVSGVSVAHLIGMMTMPMSLASCACCATLLTGLVGLAAVLLVTTLYVGYLIYQARRETIEKSLSVMSPTAKSSSVLELPSAGTHKTSGSFRLLHPPPHSPVYSVTTREAETPSFVRPP